MFVEINKKAAINRALLDEDVKALDMNTLSIKEIGDLKLSELRKYMMGVMIMEKLLEEYYKDNAKKLHGIVDKILRKYGGISDKDYDDFYSLANYVFANIINTYDEDCGSFEAYLYSCLVLKIKTAIRDRNRGKRSNTYQSVDDNGDISFGFISDVSIDTVVGEEDTTIGDMIANLYYNVEVDMEERNEYYSEKMEKYLSKLSELQRKIVKLITMGYKAREIESQLHITAKQYTDCMIGIGAYRNVSILL